MTEQYTVDSAASSIIPGFWDGAVLEPLAEINEQLIETLAGGTGEGLLPDFPLTSALRVEWRALSLEHRRRMAACPYLLVDAGFSQPERWANTAALGVRDSALAHRVTHGVRRALGATLLRRMLVLAWHLARSNRLTARIALGMTAPCAALIATARLQDLEALAELRPAWIRPHWEDRPEVWRQMLEAAGLERPAALQQLQLRGLQLLAAGAMGRFS